MNLLEEKTIEILNYRIQQEEYSSRLYHQMHLWLENNSYKNLAKYFKKNSDDEMTHASWSKEYLMSFNVMPELRTLEEPINVFDNVLDIAQKTLEHEIKITEQCNTLSKFALDNSDFGLLALAQKYNTEQTEEIGVALELLDVVQMSNDKLVIDNYVGENLL